jgi:RHS repeat-associated protein
MKARFIENRLQRTLLTVMYLRAMCMWVKNRYNSMGKITSCANNMDISMDGDTETVRRTFVYDGFYRLVTSTGEQDWAPNTQTPQIMQNYGVSTSYDNVHNITNKTQYVNTYSPPGSAPTPYAAKTYNNNYSYGAKPHAPTQIGGNNYSYDADGNQTGFTYDTFSRSISWDAENRIKSVSDTAQSANLLTERYYYNDAGQRVIKRTLDSDTSANGETEYINQFVSMSRSDGQNGYILTKNYYLGNEREASSVAPVDYGGLTETTYYFHTDHLGSSTYLMDSNGNIAEHIEYTTWGEMWNEQAMAGVTTTGVPNYFFTSKELDLTQLYYFGARYYDPQTSVWQSPDPALKDYIPSIKQLQGSGSTFFGMNGILARNATKANMSLLKQQKGFNTEKNSKEDVQDLLNDGVFDDSNLSLYSYAGNRPIVFIDPNGLIKVGWEGKVNTPLFSSISIKILGDTDTGKTSIEIGGKFSAATYPFSWGVSSSIMCDWDKTKLDTSVAAGPLRIGMDFSENGMSGIKLGVGIGNPGPDIKAPDVGISAGGPTKTLFKWEF